MVKTGGAYEAKTLFSQLLKGGVNGGGSVVITNHGVPVARLVPVVDQRDAREAIDRWVEKRKSITLGPDLTIREMIEESRRF